MIFEKKSKEETRNLTYTIQNIVVKCSLNLNSDIDLVNLANTIKNTEYDKKRFPGLFFRMTNPKCVIIIFRTGKMILTGIKSFKHIKLILNLLIKELNEKININIDNDLVESEVVNIVITANFFEQINLDLATLTLNNAIFEPEVFPGLIYKSLDPIKCVFLIFNSGNVVLTGIRKKENIDPALINLGRLIKKKKLFMKDQQ
jgi:transcription initiation factor TFIID TATA-box-binding protein